MFSHPFQLLSFTYSGFKLSKNFPLEHKDHKYCNAQENIIQILNDFEKTILDECWHYLENPRNSHYSEEF